jgi:hypothetical protein
MGDSGGNFTVATGLGGVITQTDMLTIAGTATFSASYDITLSQSNQFSGVVIINSTNGVFVTLVNSRALALGPSTISGNLRLTVAGAVTQTGPLVVGGGCIFTTDDLLLNDTHNSLETISLLTINSGIPHNAVIASRWVVSFGYSIFVSGNLTVNAGGPIMQSFGIFVGGTSSFSAGNFILLDKPNYFTGSVSFNISAGAGNYVSVSNSYPLVLGASTIRGNLTVNAAGPITQTGTLVVFGDSSISAGDNPITLNRGYFIGSVSINNSGQNDVLLFNNQPLLLAASAAGGNLTVRAGSLIQSGTIQSGGNIALTCDNGLPGDTIQLGGNLVAGGSITLAGPVSLGSDSLLSAENVSLQNGVTGNGHTLTVTGFATLSGGTLDMANSHFVFQNSFEIGTDILYLKDWNGAVAGGGASQLFAGNSASGLSPAQLAKVRFVNPTVFPTEVRRGTILSTGEVVPAPRPTLQFVRSGSNLILNWNDPSVLQSASNVTGPYLDISSASSPYTNTIEAVPSLFFRLR